MGENVEQSHTADIEHKDLRSKLIFFKQKAAYRFALGYAKRTRALDIGCGSGYGANMLSFWADSVVATDKSEEVLEYCRKRYSRGNLDFAREARGAFSLITCFQVLEHIPKPHEFLNMLKKAARGPLIFTVPNPEARWLERGEKPWNPDHYKEYYRDELYDLLARHFDVLGICGIHGSPDADKYERLRTAGGEKMKVMMHRTPHEDWADHDFAIGPAEGSLDLLAVCR